MNGRSSILEYWVMRILIINVVIYFIQMITSPYIAQYSYIYNNEVINSTSQVMSFYLGLTPALIIVKGYIWQLVTYMFLHGNFMHIAFNMYALLIFGVPIEQYMGTKKFLIYYFFTGIGAGITICALNLIMGGSAAHGVTIGASGAVFGLLLAFGILYPNIDILLFFIIPMKAKYMVILFGAIELYFLISSGGQGGISHVGHLGGILFGLIYFLVTRKKGLDFKRKIVTAQFKKEMQQKTPESHVANDDNKDFLEDLLVKIKTSGYQDLNDDEIQHLKYLEIMFSDGDTTCDETYTSEDSSCRECNTVETCLLREIKKHIP